MINLGEPENNKKDNLITLYPFNGRSPYLIDKFYIIGYNYLTLEKTLIKNTPKAIEEDNEKDIKETGKRFFEFDEEPTILNEIANDYCKETLDTKTILQMIFPHKLKCYYISEETSSNVMLKRTVATKVIDKNDVDDFQKIEFVSDDNVFIKDRRIVFSSNPQSANNSKKSINGHAHTFYRKFIKRKHLDKKIYTYYIPYTFCIISEYPFFSSFDKLIQCIKNIYSQEIIYIPIEILIYNIISLTPSPLNSDVVLNLELFCEQEKNFKDIKARLINSLRHQNNLKDKGVPINFKIEQGNNYKINYKSSRNVRNRLESLEEKREDKFKNIFQKQLPFRRTISHNMVMLNKKINENETYKIEFKFLSGYPLIQYNLSKVLFNNLSIEKIITIFLYMFLEKDVVFFSKDEEYLTLCLNAFLNLNFPLNDEKYYFIGTAISLNDFIEGNSEFGLKNYTSLIGINDAFRADYRNKNIKINDHLAIDLDRGEVIQGEEIKDKFTATDENNKKLVKLIERMCKENTDDTKMRNKTLYQAIKNLSKRLKIIYEKSYDPSIKSIPGDYMTFNDKPPFNIYLLNKEIQESFYEFVLNICLYFYENLSIKSAEDEGINKGKKELEMNVIFDENYNTQRGYNEEELIFLKELKTTTKYQSFVFAFLQSYNPIDLYKIPLTFTEEFLSIISRKKEEIISNTSKIKFFKLIDDLYLPRKTLEKKELNFEFSYISYFSYYKNRIDREIYDRDKKRFNYDKTTMIKLISNEKRMFLYQTYELDDNILLDYLHLIKNLKPNEYLQIFNKFYIEENILNKIEVTDIESCVENNCIKENMLTKSDICCCNILILFSLSLKILGRMMDCQGFLGILFQNFSFFRKYYSILLKTIFKLCQLASKEKKNITNTAFCYYPCINSIRNKKVVPNEDLMKMITQFNKIDINELSLADDKKKEKEEKDKNEDVDLYGDKLEEKDISYKTLYVFGNFTSRQFYKEKTIVDNINLTNKDNISTNTGETFYPRIRFYNGVHKIESFFISQKILLEGLLKEYNKFIENLDYSKLTLKLILDSVLNIFIYMRNDDDFEGMDDVFDVLKRIFYIFMNQLLILKTEKEKRITEKLNK